MITGIASTADGAVAAREEEAFTIEKMGLVTTFITTDLPKDIVIMDQVVDEVTA